PGRLGRKPDDSSSSEPLLCVGKRTYTVGLLRSCRDAARSPTRRESHVVRLPSANRVHLCVACSFAVEGGKPADISRFGGAYRLGGALMAPRSRQVRSSDSRLRNGKLARTMGDPP